MEYITTKLKVWLKIVRIIFYRQEKRGSVLYRYINDKLDDEDYHCNLEKQVVVKKERYTMRNVADILCEAIMEKKSPIVVGLDPVISKIPNCYIEKGKNENPFKLVADTIVNFNKDIIDCIFKFVPAVKPQMAFYEQYGSYGIRAFEETVKYARSKGLIIIEDGKRNDIGNTAMAYAKGHLGVVEMTDGTYKSSFGVDFLTVSPFLGSEGYEPFVDVCIEHNKGIFILARTSNSSSGEIQDAVLGNGNTISEEIGRRIAAYAERFCGEKGYSAIGAVVGATYPEEAKLLRKLMPKNIFLVPGYGAQGANADDIVVNFNDDGLGAIVNASRSIIYSYEKASTKAECTRELYTDCVKEATRNMQQDIYNTLKKRCKNLLY